MTRTSITPFICILTQPTRHWLIGRFLHGQEIDHSVQLQTAYIYIYIYIKFDLTQVHIRIRLHVQGSKHTDGQKGR